MSSTRPAPPPVQIDIVDPRDVPLAARTFGEEKLMLIKEQVSRGWKRQPTDAELEFMAAYCQNGHYDMFARPPQISFILRWDSNAGREVITPQKTIDGQRLDAARSGDYLGQVGPQWCGDDGVWVDVWLRREPPRAARCGVLRRGSNLPLWSVALYDEWVQTTDEWKDGHKTGKRVPTSFWDTKPAHMLAKTAEMMSLKRAVPAETSPELLEARAEQQRLAAPGHAATYSRIFGDQESRSAYELPQGYVPTDVREVQDRPRPALNAGGDLVDTTTGEVLREAQPKPAARERTMGNLLEEYGKLLSLARHSGAVPEGQVSGWLLPQGATRDLLEKRGKALRAVYDVHATAQRNQATIAHAAAVEYPVSTDPDINPEELQAELETDAAIDAVENEPIPMVLSVRDEAYQALAHTLEEAARLDIDYRDCQAETGCARQVLIDRRNILEQRIAAVKEALASGRGRQGTALQPRL